MENPPRPRERIARFRISEKRKRYEDHENASIFRRAFRRIWPERRRALLGWRIADHPYQCYQRRKMGTFNLVIVVGLQPQPPKFRTSACTEKRYEFSFFASLATPNYPILVIYGSYLTVPVGSWPYIWTSVFGVRLRRGDFIRVGGGWRW